MINGYVKSGKTCEALSFYGKIEEEGVMPDEVTKRNVLGPGPNARVVYIDGAFDLFHAGHVEILKSARQLGDFLLVGLHTDQIVSEQRGIHFPLMHLHERSLSVLACRYVDEVIIGAPLEITKDMITTFNISLVVHGTVCESKSSFNGQPDPYSVPKSMVVGECGERGGVHWWRRVKKMMVGRRRYSGVMVVEEVEWKMKKKRLNHWVKGGEFCKE
ncbi:ethanolamine-phosphate cytidylyltransferase-like protein [Tanacetum coccineum]